MHLAKRNTSAIGQIGEIAVMQRLVRSGWQVLIPYGNSAPYDLVAANGDRFIRIQVRTTKANNGYLSVNCRSKNNRARTQPGNFDFLVVYEITSDAAFVIPEAEIVKRAVLHIRLSPALSGQVQGTRPARDCRERWDKLVSGA
jgi:hypothetical protein